MSGVARLHSVVLDCPEPKALADFYAGLLGWKVADEEEDWVTLAGGDRTRLAFQRVAEYVPPVWPSAEHPQQFHLDLTVNDMAEAENQVLALGAVRHEHQPDEGCDWTVFLDPAGHPFCLVTG
ncbi:VOC family protein [Microbispora bryophytorum]|uniref:VOC family protein n=1 Tax=Microbispora bryophytorum subsp. camponoti TaxID=1677852 RepID=A0ABR8L567_9ACTN|nr:VOC family protein [Microbispora camponoti]MBD3143604.1 VOC family protein [Microbispora camponoti]